MISRFGQIVKSLPVLAPVDIAATATKTAIVNLAGAHRATFFIQFGNIAAASADQAVTVTLLAATGAASTGATAIAFNYRLSGAVATDTLGNITAATSAGVSIATTDDGKMLLIDVDPAVARGANTDKDCSYVYALITPDAGATATLVSAQCALEPRYAQNSMVSAS